MKESTSTTSAVTSTATIVTSTVTNESAYTVYKTNQTDLAGYEVVPSFANSNYTLMSVSASWIVTEVNCSGVPPNQEEDAAAMWVGIGDYKTNDLEQIGTGSACIGTRPDYSAWYEFFPAISIYIGTVNAGDVIDARVSYTPSSGGANFTLSLSDQTEGWSKNYSGSGGGTYVADWAVERQGNGISPLANFGVFNFTNCRMTVTDPSGALLSTPIDYHDYVIQATLVSKDYTRTLASVSWLSQRGTAFAVTWENSQ